MTTIHGSDLNQNLIAWDSETGARLAVSPPIPGYAGSTGYCYHSHYATEDGLIWVANQENYGNAAPNGRMLWNTIGYDLKTWSTTVAATGPLDSNVNKQALNLEWVCRVGTQVVGCISYANISSTDPNSGVLGYQFVTAPLAGGTYSLLGTYHIRRDPNTYATSLPETPFVSNGEVYYTQEEGGSLYKLDVSSGSITQIPAFPVPDYVTSEYSSSSGAMRSSNNDVFVFTFNAIQPPQDVLVWKNAARFAVFNPATVLPQSQITTGAIVIEPYYYCAVKLNSAVVFAKVNMDTGAFTFSPALPSGGSSIVLAAGYPAPPPAPAPLAPVPVLHSIEQGSGVLFGPHSIAESFT